MRPATRRLIECLALALAAVTASASPARAQSGAPDLVIELPGTAYPGQVAPVYVDAF